MVKSTLSQYTEKLFSHLPDLQAEELAWEGVIQLGAEGYKGVGFQGLFDAIKTAYSHPNSLRMQTGISKKLKYAQTIQGPDGEKVIALPRRLITTYETKYRPSNFTLGMQEWEKLNYLEKTRGMDTREVARLARQNLRKVYNSALERGIRYGLLLTLTTDSSTLTHDRGPLTDMEGNEIPHIRKLKLIIPKTDQKEKEIINAFCDQYQIPNKNLVDKLLGITD